MRKHLLIILCGLLLTIGCKLFDPGIHGVSIDKIREARKIASQQNSGAHIVTATGRRKNNEFMTDPKMTEVFEFMAAAYNPIGFTYNYWKLIYEDDEWSMSSIITVPLGIDASIDLEDVEMDVCDAWDQVMEDNNADSFYNWALSKPIYPYVERPFFRFATDSGAFSVYPSTYKIGSEGY
jgi:hypothetical protein